MLGEGGEADVTVDWSTRAVYPFWAEVPDDTAVPCYGEALQSAVIPPGSGPPAKMPQKEYYHRPVPSLHRDSDLSSDDDDIGVIREEVRSIFRIVKSES